jgi:hypothetical protein
MRSSTEATRLAQLPYRDSGLVQYMFCDAGLFYDKKSSEGRGVELPLWVLAVRKRNLIWS